MRVFLIISFICSLAYALTTTPGWNGGNVVLNSIQGTAGNLPITSTAGNPINIIPGAIPAWNFQSTGHFTPNSDAAVSIGAPFLSVKDQYWHGVSTIFRGAEKYIHSPDIDNFYSGRAAGQSHTNLNASNLCQGAFSCTSLSAGSRDTYLGTNAAIFATGGDDNSGYGQNTLRFLINGNRNTAGGQFSSGRLVAQNDTTSLGFQAASGFGIGDFTTALGSLSAESAGAGCSGATLTGYNSGRNCHAIGLSCFGKNACAGSSVGGDNGSYFGENSGLVNSGPDNSCFGKDSCSTTTSGARLIMIGNGRNATSPTASDELGIGGWVNGTNTNLFLKAKTGTFGLNVASTGTTTAKALAVHDNGISVTPNWLADVRGDLGNVPAAQTNVVAVADVASSLNNKYFYVSVPTGFSIAPYADLYFWFNVGGAGVDPAPRGPNAIGVEVPIAVNATAATVAAAITAACPGSYTSCINSPSVTVQIYPGNYGKPQVLPSAQTSGMAVTQINPGTGDVFAQFSSSTTSHLQGDGLVIGQSAIGRNTIAAREGLVITTYPYDSPLVLDSDVTFAPGRNIEMNGTVTSSITAIGDVSGANINGINIVASAEVVAQNGNISIQGIGAGLYIAQGADSRMDSCTLAAGTCTITNVTVQAAGSGAGTDSIYCTGQDDNGGTAGAVRVSARTVGVDYTVTSTSVLDTSIVSCLLVGGS